MFQFFKGLVRRRKNKKNKIHRPQEESTYVKEVNTDEFESYTAASPVRFERTERPCPAVNDHLSELEATENEDTVGERGGLRCDVSVVTDVGRERDNNEDNFFLNSGTYNHDMCDHMSCSESFVLSRRAVYAVYDGMGGESYGEVAACTASSMMVEMQKSISQSDDSQVMDRVQDYAAAVNDRLIDIMTEKSCRMGTTVAVICIESDEVIPYNCGDSRIYYVHNGVIRQLSRDHTLAQKKFEQGIYTAEEARNSGENHMLTRFLGAGRNGNGIKVYEGERICPERGDMFILCSDGLSDMCTDSEIAYVVSLEGNPAESLVNEALKNGGNDNVTVMTLKIY